MQTLSGDARRVGENQLSEGCTQDTYSTWDRGDCPARTGAYTLPSSSSASCRINGIITLHGPHLGHPHNTVPSELYSLPIRCAALHARAYKRRDNGLSMTLNDVSSNVQSASPARSETSAVIQNIQTLVWSSSHDLKTYF